MLPGSVHTMSIHVTLAGRGDLVARIYRELRAAILDGRLQPGDRLPATRELAEALSVSRTTVTTVYERLTAEGFAVGRVGAGTYVGTGSQPRPTQTTPRRTTSAPVQARPVWRALPVLPGEDTQPPYDFRVGVPDASLFPYAAWRRLIANELRPSRLGAARYADPAGHAGLRAAIARHIGVSRSVRAEPDDILVTHGAQQALDLVARVLLSAGDCVAVEEPGYPTARRLFQSYGTRVVGVPVDRDGLVIDALPAAARLVYTTPSHQFPLGTPMSLARRTALLAWAARRGAAVIEDDYDTEFRFAGRPLEPLHSLDREGRVIYVGSFSKTLLPMLRVGFLVTPASLGRELRLAKQLSDWHGDLVTQGALARFIDDGLLARHVRRAAREYADRRARIVSILEGELSSWLVPVAASAGLHLCTRLAPGRTTDMDAVVRQARSAGLGLQPLADFCGNEPQAGIVLGYGTVDPDRIEQGLALLGSAFRRVDPLSAPRSFTPRAT